MAMHIHAWKNKYKVSEGIGFNQPPGSVGSETQTLEMVLKRVYCGVRGLNLQSAASPDTVETALSVPFAGPRA